MRIFRMALAAAAIAIHCAHAVASPADTVAPFPLDHYDQNIDHWLKPGTPGYAAPVIPAAEQKARMEALTARYFGTGKDAQSPWNSTFIENVLHQQGQADLVAIERGVIRSFDNRGKPPEQLGYGQNFRPHADAWIDTIAVNMRLDEFDSERRYRPERRAIAVDNIRVRGLPTSDPFFRDHRLAGEGYPFDYLQVTAIWAGTPIYVLSESLDQNWLFVQTPDVIGWVRRRSVARVSDDFVRQWRKAARRSLAAVTRTGMALVDTDGRYRFTGYLGAVFPRVSSVAGRIRLMIPAMNVDRTAAVRYADVSSFDAVAMPLAATPKNFAMLMKIQQSRPYGWGNTGFYNDCSAELKSLFTPLGIWLPRNSGYQVKEGKLVDLSNLDTAGRLNFLAQHGKALSTLIYIPGHIMLYIGNDTRGANPIPMTYQDIWGLRPADNSRRAVIGQALVFPLLTAYPEDTGLESLAGKRFFRLSYLGETPWQSLQKNGAVVPYEHLLPEMPDMPQ